MSPLHVMNDANDLKLFHLEKGVCFMFIIDYFSDMLQKKLHIDASNYGKCQILPNISHIV